MSFEGSRRIEVKGSSFFLLKEKAAFLFDPKVLVVADLHLGKDVHFSRHGLPIGGATNETFENLRDLIALTQPSQIVFAGDLFHSSINESWPIFVEFVSGLHAPVSLARGNHDVIPARRYEELGIRAEQTIEVPPFAVYHHPPVDHTAHELYGICGHIHPGVKIGAGPGDVLPCFVEMPGYCILPAFGRFTGFAKMNGSVGRLSVVTPEKVIPLEPRVVDSEREEGDVRRRQKRRFSRQSRP